MGRIVGSRLIAQKFTRPEYFQARPSAVDYNAASTGGSNLGPTNPDHLKAVQERLDAITKLESVEAGKVPSEMVTTSGGGLDPDIPPAAADLQANRVATARGVPVERVRELIRAHTEPPTFGFLGRDRVNVLELNLALDESLAPRRPTAAGRHKGTDMSERARRISIWDPAIIRQATLDSFWKLDPRIQIRNPVMFIVEVGSVITTFIWLRELLGGTGHPLFTGQVAFWLWFTVLFANFAEAMAEGRGKAQAASLRKTRAETMAERIRDGGPRDRPGQRAPRGGRRAGGGRPDHTGRRRGDRRRGECRRVGHHR